MLTVMLLYSAQEFFTTYKAHPWHDGLVMVLGLLVMIPVWAAGWTIGNRFFGYKDRFHSHLAVVSAIASIAFFSDLVIGAVRQMLYREVVWVFAGLIDLALLGSLLYLHIRVASRWKPRTNALVAGLIVVALASLTLLPLDTDAAKPVKAALDGLSPLPVALYVTRPADHLETSADEILKRLDGMKAKQSVERPSPPGG